MSSDSQYIDRKAVNASYRPKSNLMSPGLKRAREPFRVRNAITGIVLGAFAVGVWAYSISAVKQDVFDDVDEEARILQGSVPDPARAPHSGSELGIGIQALETAVVGQRENGVADSSLGSVVSEVRNTTGGRSRYPGILVGVLDRRFPGLLDPKHKTLVWGAPPVDDFMQRRNQ